MKYLQKIFAMIVLFNLAACTGSNLNRDSDFDNNATEFSEKEIKITDLPKPIKDAIADKYVGAELLEADEITHVDGKITYDVEIKYQSKVIELMYDLQGKFLGQEEEEEEEEEDDDDNDDKE